MLRGLTWSKFLEWKAFESLEPFGEERQDYRIASVVQSLYNIFTREKMSNPSPLGEFLLGFGDMPKPEGIKQTVEYQEMLIDAWISTNNAIVRQQHPETIQ